MFPGFSKVKGIGQENIAKVVGLIDIEKAPTISSLWKFAGRAPGCKAKKGEKLPYNKTLKSMTWRLGTSLLKAGGKYYEKYLEYKRSYQERCAAQGIKIVPAAQLPTNADGKKYEPEGMISEGHIHMLALNKMIKLFLANLWLVWRENAGLPTRAPYAQDYLQHSHIVDPWEMVEK